ncbi:MAG: hypothetical protein JWR76_2361 [Mucilaginibacter sp.]|nr:hypothetical protein [Mucilaginibacter sp.]
MEKRLLLKCAHLGSNLHLQITYFQQLISKINLQPLVRCFSCGKSGNHQEA